MGDIMEGTQHDSTSDKTNNFNGEREQEAIIMGVSCSPSQLVWGTHNGGSVDCQKNHQPAVYICAKDHKREDKRRTVR